VAEQNVNGSAWFTLARMGAGAGGHTLSLIPYTCQSSAEQKENQMFVWMSRQTHASGTKCRGPEIQTASLKACERVH
jgi:6-phosphogluconolactonase/glucosamine-6-phosphate isomerase/deaminase